MARLCARPHWQRARRPPGIRARAQCPVGRLCRSFRLGLFGSLALLCAEAPLGAVCFATIDRGHANTQAAGPPAVWSASEARSWAGAGVFRRGAIARPCASYVMATHTQGGRRGPCPPLPFPSGSMCPSAIPCEGRTQGGGHRGERGHQGLTKPCDAGGAPRMMKGRKNRGDVLLGVLPLSPRVLRQS